MGTRVSWGKGTYVNGEVSVLVMPATGRRGRRLVLLAVAVMLVVAGLPVPAFAATAPTARVADWSIPERLHDTDQDGFIDLYLDCQPNAPGTMLTRPDHCRSAEVEPPAWYVTVDACTSTAGDAEIVDYRFMANGHPSSLRTGTACSRTLPLPALGAYTVEVTVTDADGLSSTTSVPVVVRDLLVASIGDSYGSGEGAPPFIDQAGLLQSSRCDRSSRAASAQAALKLEQADDKTSVTFLHLACSGAQMVDGTPNNGEANGGLLEPYQGANPTTGTNGTQDIIPPQVDYLKALIGNRKLDYLHVSIGGNDVGFADIITACIDPMYAQALAHYYVFHDPQVLAAWLALPNCDLPMWDPTEVLTGFRSAGLIFQEGIAGLPDRYRRLNEALEAKLGSVVEPQQVYITEYPDFTRGDDGDWCGFTLDDPLSTADLPGFTKSEFRWASEIVAPTLNVVMKEATEAYGWNHVTGISSAYGKNGYCATDHWIVGLKQSLDARGAPTSAFHPNVKGQTVAGERLFAKMFAHLKNPPAPPTITFHPTALVFAANIPGELGWTTGECQLFGGACDRDETHWTVRVKGTAALQGPLEQHLTLAIDGQPASISRDATGTLVCRPANAADACDVFPGSGANPVDAHIVVRMTRGGSHSLDVSATSVQGMTATGRYEFAVDLQPPTTAPANIASGILGDNGWYVSPVTLSLAASDMGGSGLRGMDVVLRGAGPEGQDLLVPTSGSVTAGPITATVSAEGAHVVGYEAFDQAGLRSGDALTRTPSGPSLFPVKIDTIAPIVSGAPDREPDVRGWYNEQVTVTFTATDTLPGSGVDPSSLTPPTPLGDGAGQTVTGNASDRAGHTADPVTVGPVSVDLTPPALSVTGGSDGTFSYTAANLLSGTTVTNATSLELSYNASDALSGLYVVEAGGSTASTATGTLTVPLPLGQSTVTLRAEDVAGNARDIVLTLVRVEGAATAAPEGAGFWGNATSSGQYTEAAFEALLGLANTVSDVFGPLPSRYAEVTPATAGDVLKLRPASTLDERVRRDLLAGWLNVVSGRQRLDQGVDLRKVKGWDTVVTNTGGDSRTTTLDVMRQLELRLAGTATKAQLEAVQRVLDDLNTGSLNIR